MKTSASTLLLGLALLAFAANDARAEAPVDTGAITKLGGRFSKDLQAHLKIWMDPSQGRGTVKLVHGKQGVSGVLSDKHYGDNSLSTLVQFSSNRRPRSVTIEQSFSHPAVFDHPGLHGNTKTTEKRSWFGLVNTETSMTTTRRGDSVHTVSNRTRTILGRTFQLKAPKVR